MSEYYCRNVSITGSQDFSDLKVTRPVTIAGGALGVKEALKHGFKEMGIVRTMSALQKMNQVDGFECPSCAWPDPEKSSKFAEYCENGAKALADEATTRKIDAEFFAKHSVEALSQLTDFELNKFGRLTVPLVLLPNSVHYQPITWEKAFELLAQELHALASPNEAIFYTSGRSSNEAAFLYGMFARALGTNNMPDCSNMCHESSGIALGETLGIGKGSIKLEDLYEAEVILIAGQNPGTNHPRMLTALEKCKEKGGKIISINPLEESGLVNFKNPQKIKGWIGSATDIADIHLQVKINEDIALLKAILKKLSDVHTKDSSVFDLKFIENYTDGYKDLLADLETYSLSKLIAQSGVSEAKIDATVALLAKKSNIVVCWAMGLTQHKNGVATIKEYINLLLT